MRNSKLERRRPGVLSKGASLDWVSKGPGLVACQPICQLDFLDLQGTEIETDPRQWPWYPLKTNPYPMNELLLDALSWARRMARPVM